MKPEAPNYGDDTLRWQALTQSELEREYSPSSAVGGNYQLYIEEYTSRSVASRNRCNEVKSLRYGDLDSNLIDFVPAMGSAAKAASEETEIRSPLLVFIHGGYWQEGSRDDSLFGADYFAEQGIAYAAIGYTLAPNATLPDIVKECRQAMTSLTDNAASLHIDPDRIVVAGSSAGAHLAAMCCTAETPLIGSPPNPIAGLVLMSGVFDLQPLISTYVNDAVGVSLEEAIALSPVQHDLSAFPYTLISWGENETDQFKRQSNVFAKALRASDIATTKFEAAGRNHFDIVHDLADPQSGIGRCVLSMILQKN